MRHVNRLKTSAKAACPVLIALVCGIGQFSCSAGDAPQVANRIPANNPNVANGGANHQLLPFIELARTSRDAVLAVKDYEAIFTKQELVGRNLFYGRMLIKLRHEPFGVYLRFIDQNKGREVLYSGQRYQYKMMAHEAPGTLSSMVGTISLEPNSARRCRKAGIPSPRSAWPR